VQPLGADAESLTQRPALSGTGVVVAVVGAVDFVHFLSELGGDVPCGGRSRGHGRERTLLSGMENLSPRAHTPLKRVVNR
jgi:hypothetical protein